MSKSKDYLKGFKHGVRWTLLMAKVEPNLEEIRQHSKKAVKSLKEGR